jgi:hypothetical protein
VAFGQKNTEKRPQAIADIRNEKLVRHNARSERRDILPAFVCYRLKKEM